MGMKKITASILLSGVLLTGTFLFVPSKPAYAFGVGDIFSALGTVTSALVFPTSIPGLVAQLIPSTEGEVMKEIVGTKGLVSLGLPGQSIPKPTSTADVIQQYGALGGIGLGLGQMYNPPVTVNEYLASVHPLGNPAYADTVPQTTSTIFGKEIFSLWTAARNLAYILFVLILVAIGFMLMLRSKIDPRTTVTVTAALPGLVFALILITLSMAIATLMINFGQLLEEVIKNILTNPVLTSNTILANPCNGTTAACDSVGLTVTDIWLRFISPNGNAFTSLGGTVAGFSFTSMLLDFILLVITLVLAVQIFIMLLLRYINILVKPIFAPVAFLFGAIPGRSGMTIKWFKGYLVDILVFPTALLLLNIGMAIRSSGGVGNLGDPFGVFEAGANLGPLIAIGILIMVTKIPAFLEEAFDIKASPYTGKAGGQPDRLVKSVPVIGGFLK